MPNALFNVIACIIQTNIYIYIIILYNIIYIYNVKMYSEVLGSNLISKVLAMQEG